MKSRRLLWFAGLLVVLASIIGVGCARPVPTPVAAGLDITTAMVPNVDLDLYAVFKQDIPTKIPKGLVGSDVAVDSFAVWGVSNNDQLTLAGALKLTDADAANRIKGQIPVQANIWTSVSDKTVYFVQGTGPAADSLKNAISKNDFRVYPDKDSLAEVARLPSGGNTKLAAVAIVKPVKSVIQTVSALTSQKTADMINSLVASAQIRPLVLGLYAPGHIEAHEMIERAGRSALWEGEMGVIALVRSSLPGAVVGPVASRYLENAGYASTKIGGLTVFKGGIEAGRDKVVPFYLNIDGNRITLVVSGRDQYAQTLIGSVKR